MVTLDGQQITKKELQTKMVESKQGGKKIIEVSSGVYKTLTKMNG